ncbi:hypothetical protein D2962_07295 [Biomaibacter acetigenes]|uniref:Uncharacterized protein n=1 Tax=Biomaibacter acetigenes TaxID=2316383 RepID=A0A3G2R4L4_9FIRM|nr:hypothetical protein D2962_07295 [Biomaibacter acetigenes]
MFYPAYGSLPASLTPATSSSFLLFNSPRCRIALRFFTSLSQLIFSKKNTLVYLNSLLLFKILLFVSAEPIPLVNLSLFLLEMSVLSYLFLKTAKPTYEAQV